MPGWFGAWCAKRDRVPHEQIDIARLALGVSYARPAAAARWLADVFGFGPDGDLPEGPDPLPEGRPRPPVDRVPDRERVPHRLQARRRTERSTRTTHVPWVYVDDLEAHFAHAKGSGATIVEELHTYPGSTVYVADDLEGNRWTFSQARPTMR